MGFDVAWRTRAGRRTADNRDCAGLGVRGDEALCIVLDGSTRGADSGALARDIARGLVDWFVELESAVTAGALKAKLRDLHQALAPRRPRASASYALVHLNGSGDGLALHAGDCLLGRVRAGRAEWLLRPDTLANAFVDLDIAAIAADPARHRLTRSFRPREFMPPSALPLEDERDLVLATDGFWADLPDPEQARFLAGEDIPPGDQADDRSVLRLRIRSGDVGLTRLAEEADEGFHVRVATSSRSA